MSVFLFEIPFCYEISGMFHLTLIKQKLTMMKNLDYSSCSEL